MKRSSASAVVTEKDAEKEARRRVAEIKNFYSHLLTYLLVNSFLVTIFLLAGGGHFWPIYPIMGWGIGLVSHAASTFSFFGRFDKTWEERKVREIMLQKEHGLSADQVRALLKQEMAEERGALPSADEWRRIRQRLENLEAIVTSRDWDELPSHSKLLQVDDEPAPRPEQLDVESDPASHSDRLTLDEQTGGKTKADAAAEASRLARRVR